MTREPSIWSGLRYQLEERIATGGMAEVFRATAHSDLGFTKQVVIKRLIPALVNDAEAQRAFENELRIGVLLHHPNLARVSDAGVHDGAPFLVMDYLTGVDLEILAYRDTISRLPLAVVLHVVRQIADALAYTHALKGTDGASLGLIHRDVSPANIMLTTEGAAKLVDFGVAKSRLSTTHTRFGFIKGKPPYMSPEQCLRGELDGRTDVFSLGVVLYELATGQPLFRDLGDEQVVMRSIISGDYIGRAQKQLSGQPELQRVLIRALSVDPSSRYQSAEAMRRALSEIPAEPGDAAGTLAQRVTALVTAEQHREHDPDDEEDTNDANSGTKPGLGGGQAHHHIDRDDDDDDDEPHTDVVDPLMLDTQLGEARAHGGHLPPAAQEVVPTGPFDEPTFVSMPVEMPVEMPAEMPAEVTTKLAALPLRTPQPDPDDTIAYSLRQQPLLASEERTVVALLQVDGDPSGVDDVGELALPPIAATAHVAHRSEAAAPESSPAYEAFMQPPPMATPDSIEPATVTTSPMSSLRRPIVVAISLLIAVILTALILTFSGWSSWSG